MRHLVPIFLVSLACTDASEEASPLAAGLMPPTFALLLGGTTDSSEGEYVFRGEEMSFKIRGTPPYKTVGLAVALSEQEDGFCPSEVAPACLDLGEGASVLGTRITGGQGGTTFEVVVPHRSTFTEAFAQAAYGSRGTLVSTAVVRFNVLDRTDDLDEDGLENIEERLIGSDPFLYDTDGDGLHDGNEAECGSDPTDELDVCVAT